MQAIYVMADRKKIHLISNHVNLKLDFGNDINKEFL